jgi:hypothetical protein
MTSAVSAIPQKLPRSREARAVVILPVSRGAYSMANRREGESFWIKVFCAIIGAGFLVLVGLIGIIYWNMRDDIKDLKTDSKEIRHDVTDIRIAVTKISTQLDQILQRMPPNTPR